MVVEIFSWMVKKVLTYVGRFLKGETKDQEKVALEFYSIIFSKELFALFAIDARSI